MARESLFADRPRYIIYTYNNTFISIVGHCNDCTNSMLLLNVEYELLFYCFVQIPIHFTLYLKV